MPEQIALRVDLRQWPQGHQYQSLAGIRGEPAPAQLEQAAAVEQSGRFLSSIYEIDYRDMTRETWRRARASFDQAYEEFRGHLVAAWDKLEDEA